MIARLRALLRHLRVKLDKAQHERHQAKPHGKRRKKLAEKVRRIEAHKAKVAEDLKKAIAAGASAIVVTPGPSHWSGSDDIIRNEADPVAVRYGFSVTSRKRPASDPLSKANPGSDHNEANVTASAADYGTYSGATFAHAVAAALGITNYSTGNYNGYYIRRGNHVWRVQILWAVEGHYDHVHVGLRLVS